MNNTPTEKLFEHIVNTALHSVGVTKSSKVTKDDQKHRIRTTLIKMSKHLKQSTTEVTTSYSLTHTNIYIYIYIYIYMVEHNRHFLYIFLLILSYCRIDFMIFL